MKRDIHTVIGENTCKLVRGGKVVGQATYQGGLFELACSTVIQDAALPAGIAGTSPTDHTPPVIPNHPHNPTSHEYSPLRPSAGMPLSPWRSRSNAGLVHGYADLRGLSVSEEHSPSINGVVQSGEKQLVPGQSGQLVPTPSPLHVWHHILGHISPKRIQQLAQGAASGLEKAKLDLATLPPCVICAMGKGHKQAISKEPATRATKVLERVHTDLCGPFEWQSHGGAKYFITFIDDKTRFGAIHFLQKKSDAAAAFQAFHTWACNQQSTTIKYLRSDNGGEYIGKKFTDYLTKCGIQPELTAPNTPSQNGVSERRNRTLLDIARCLLIQSNLGQEWWAEAVFFANMITNRLPTKACKEVTPFEGWHGQKPDLSDLHIFACHAKVVIEQ